MIYVSAAMRGLIGDDLVGRARPEAVPELLRPVIAAGWVREPDGALLLATMRDGYHGARIAFVDLTGYEASVNATGIPDWDLVESDGRIDELLTRSISYAVFAILAAADTDTELRALVSLSGHDSPSDTTARVTFFVDRPDEPPLIAEPGGDGAILVFARADVAGDRR